MRNLTFSAIATVLFLGLTSCSTNESLDTVAFETENNLLKSYKVQKDVNGRYSIDVKTTSGTDVETVKNTQSNSTEIYLYSDGNSGKKDFNDNLSSSILKSGFKTVSILSKPKYSSINKKKKESISVAG